MNTPLDETERSAMQSALDDEYKAQATYEQVIRDFGPVRPFVNIVEAEARHIAALLMLFARYGLPVPDNTWPGRAPRYHNIDAACEAGVQAEIDNTALYERLLASTQRPDILTVFHNLQEASQQRHLAAFQRCVEHGAGGGGGRGGGIRQRRGRGNRP